MPRQNFLFPELHASVGLGELAASFGHDALAQCLCDQHRGSAPEVTREIVLLLAHVTRPSARMSATFSTCFDGCLGAVFRAHRHRV